MKPLGVVTAAKVDLPDSLEIILILQGITDRVVQNWMPRQNLGYKVLIRDQPPVKEKFRIGQKKLSCSWPDKTLANPGKCLGSVLPVTVSLLDQKRLDLYISSLLRHWLQAAPGWDDAG